MGVWAVHCPVTWSDHFATMIRHSDSLLGQENPAGAFWAYVWAYGRFDWMRLGNMPSINQSLRDLSLRHRRWLCLTPRYVIISLRHFHEVYEKVHNALWRVGPQVVSAKQLTGSCITLFRTPHAHVNSAIKIQNPFHIISNIATLHCNWLLNRIFEANSACLDGDDHRSMLQVFSCCRKSRTAPHVERNA